MKKIISILCVLVALVALIPFGVIAVDDVTITFNMNPDFSITASGIDDKFAYSVGGQYGDFIALKLLDGAKITFNNDISVQKDGQPLGDFKAGTVKNSADISGAYFFPAGQPGVFVMVASADHPMWVGATADQDLFNNDVLTAKQGGSAPSEPTTPAEPTEPAAPENPSVPDDGAITLPPPELADALAVGDWPLPTGQYDTGLDAAGMPNGTKVYGLFSVDSAFNITPTDIPSSVTGYTKVDTPAELVPGTYCLYTTSGGYNYILLIPAGADPGVITPTPNVPRFTVSYVPKGLEDTLYVGKWPLAAGSYDPALDEAGLADGYEVYGLFAGTFPNFTPLDPPASIMGYTKVDSVGGVKDGTYSVYNASSGYGYVILGAGRTVKPSRYTLVVDGVTTEPEVYNINGNNYFKLRDLAYLINGTEKQFEVVPDSDSVSITRGQPYTLNDADMKPGPGGEQTAKPSRYTIFLDGVKLDVTVYLIHGNNFFKLREIMEAVNVYVEASGTTVTLDTSMGYPQG